MDTKMNDIKTIALGVLLLITITLAHTICYAIDDEITAMENNKTNIPADRAVVEG